MLTVWTRRSAIKDYLDTNIPVYIPCIYHVYSWLRDRHRPVLFSDNNEWKRAWRGVVVGFSEKLDNRRCNLIRRALSAQGHERQAPLIRSLSPSVPRWVCAYKFLSKLFPFDPAVFSVQLTKQQIRNTFTWVVYSSGLDHGIFITRVHRHAYTLMISIVLLNELC